MMSAVLKLMVTADVCYVSDSRTPLAGEIGFTVGQVYTSLSGWTGERSTEAHGTSQLVLLALWLEKRCVGYSQHT